MDEQAQAEVRPEGATKTTTITEPPCGTKGPRNASCIKSHGHAPPHRGFFCDTRWVEWCDGGEVASEPEAAPEILARWSGAAWAEAQRAYAGPVDVVYTREHGILVRSADGGYTPLLVASSHLAKSALGGLAQAVLRSPEALGVLARERVRPIPETPSGRSATPEQVECALLTALGEGELDAKALCGLVASALAAAERQLPDDFALGDALEDLIRAGDVCIRVTPSGILCRRAYCDDLDAPAGDERIGLTPEGMAATEPQGPELWGIVWGPAERLAIQAFFREQWHMVSQIRSEAPDRLAAVVSDMAWHAAAKTWNDAVNEYDSTKAIAALAGVIPTQEELLARLTERLGASPTAAQVAAASRALRELSYSLLSGGDS